jgi:ribosomal protein S13
VYDLIRSMHYFGEKKADAILRTAGIDRRKRVEEMTGRQARAVAVEIMRHTESMKLHRADRQKYQRNYMRGHRRLAA